MRKFRNKKGFTLMETVIVVAIIAIIAGIVAGATRGYKRKLIQLDYDTSAQEIFVAAQNHLALADSQGYLGRTDFGKAEDEDAGIFYFVVGDGADDPDDEDSVLNLMLPYAAIDEYVREKGSYIIRYQKAPAQILDVFYADRESSNLTHTFAASEYTELMASYTGSEKKTVRRSYGPDKTVIGYYGGVEAVDAARGEKLEAPSIIINNGDKLTAVVSNPNSGNANAALKLVISGETSGACKTIPLVDTNGAVCTPGTYKFEYDIISCEFTVVLDDITVQNSHFKDMFCGGADPEGSLIPGENITVKAVAYSSKEITNIAQSGEKRTNSLYGSLTGESAEITNFRHLENLSDDISGKTVTVTEAKQTADLVWGKEDSIFNSSVVIYGADQSAHTAGSFVPVDISDALDYQGAEHSVEGLNITATGDAGLFEALPSGSAVSELELVDFNVYSSGGKAGALAGSAAGSDISAVIARNNAAEDDTSLTIKGSTAAGGLVGTVSGGSIESCAAAVYVQALNGYAGGLAGTVSNATVADSYAGGHTSEARYQDSSTGAGRYNVLASTGAGGFIGKTQNTSVSYCYSSCSAHGSNAAGFICSTSGGAVSNSYCVGRATSEGEAQVGAFVSEHTSTTFSGTNYYLNNISDNVKQEDIDNVLGVSGKDTETEAFIIPEDSRQGAYPYDDVLATAYVGKYYFPTVEQLDSAAEVTAFFTASHYGDWQIPGMDTLDLMLYNDDTLRLVIEKKEEDFDKITLAVSGEASNKTKVFLLSISGNTITVDKVGTVQNRKIVWDTASTLTKKLPCKMGDNGITVIFDDITLNDRHFNQLFGDVLTPGENISVRAGTGEASWLELSASTPCLGNSLFTRGSEPIGTAGIAYVRQLQNLDPEISAVSALVKTAKLEDNMVWNAEIYPHIYNKTGTKNISGSFYGIYNSNIKTFKGENYSISGLVINSAPEGISGAGAGNAGLFRLVDNGMTASKVKIDDFKVTASGNAGSFAAEVSGTGATLDTILSVSDTVKISSTGSGKPAGGLVGTASAALTLDNCAASVLVDAKGPAGGLVGSSSGTLKINKSYAGGHTDGSGEFDLSDYNVTSSAAAAGGLVGEISSGSVEMAQSFSAASAASPTTTAAGGIVGKTAADISMDTVYAIAPVKNVKVKLSDPESPSGAFIGEVEAGATVTNTTTYYLPEVYPGSEMVNNRSSVAYEGNGQGTLTSEVGCAYYEQDGVDNAISAKKYVSTMQIKTYPYDASLNEGNPVGGKEYPFSIWTNFEFDYKPAGGQSGKTYGTYYGDWQPILSPATVTHTISFKYIDPVTSTLKSISDDLATQTIFEGQDNRVLLPFVPNTSGYSVNYWYLESDTATRFIEDVGYITVPEALSDTDITVIATFKKDAEKCRVSFFYDRTGANTSFEQIGNTITVDPGTARNSLNVPSRDIVEHVFDGWYSDPNFNSPISFESGTVNSDINAYAKYKPIEYYTVTIDFMYTTAEGDTSHLSNVPRYRVEDEPQFRIQAIRGEVYDDFIVLPSLGVEPMSVVHYEGDSAGEASLSTDKTKLYITADTDSHFIILYEGRPTEVEHYKIMYRMHNTRSNGSTSSNFVFSQNESDVYTYNPYQGQDTGDNFTAPVGTIPDVKPQIIHGFVYPASENIHSVQISPDESKNVIYVDYYRSSYILTFDSMSGTYVPPVMLYYGQTISTSQPATNPTRQGYSFSKWCIHDQGAGKETETYNWTRSTMPANNIEAAAKWTPGTSNYTVIFWRQRVTDNKNLDNAQKTYEFADIAVRTGTTGNTAKLTNSDTGKSNSGDYVGYTYNSANSDTAGKTIAADGSTVLNVYYDRNLITMNFSNLGTVYNKSDSDAAIYGLINGNYVELRKGSDGVWYRQESYQEQEETQIVFNGTKYYVATDNSGTQYGVVDGSIEELSYRSPFGSNTKRWQYRSWLLGYSDYNGTRYKTSGSGTAYRFADGQMQPLDYVNGQYVYTAVTTVTKYRDVPYTGDRYTKVGSPYTGLYGQPLSMYGYSWPDGSWSYGSTGMSYLGQFVLPTPTNTSITFSRSSTTRGSHYYFYLEDENGNYVYDAEGGTSSGSGTFTFTEKYDGYTVVQARTASSQAALANTGWQTKHSGDTLSSKGYMEIRFDRKSFELSFYNTLEGTEYGSGAFGPKTIKFGKSLASYKPAGSPTTTRASEGYFWDGKYYADKACTTELDFGTYVMPSRNLTVFIKFTLPIYNVDFELRDPAPSEGEAAHYKAQADEGYSFVVEMNKSLGDKVADQSGKLKDGYTPEKSGWSFDGWYYSDNGTEKPFINSMGIQKNMTVYARWSRTVSTEKRPITVKYCDMEGTTLAPDSTLSDQTVGYTVTIPARDIEGYYPQYMIQYLTVSDEIDNVITFYYNEIKAWHYTVEYYARYSSYETAEAEISDLSISTGHKDYFLARQEDIPAYNQYETVEFTMPEGVTGYHFDHWEYAGESGTTNLTRITPDANKTALIKYYVEPDSTLVTVSDSVAVYNGDSHAVKEEVRPELNIYSYPTGTTGEVKLYLRYFDASGTALRDDQVVDAGVYGIHAYLVLQITGKAEGDSASATRSFLLWKETDSSLCLKITRRSVTITSDSATAAYDENSVLQRSDSQQNITIVGPDDGYPAFVGGQGVDIVFSVEAFRLNPGATYNSFVITLWDGSTAGKVFTNPDNYEITRVFGVLTVTE